ncbi:putative RNA-directed DNA polymerase [Tanacetum coccineum]
MADSWKAMDLNRFVKRVKSSPTDASFLESLFSINEIKSAIWECDGLKAPEPDGFNFKFIKTYWNVIKDDVVNCVKYFETSGKLAAGCNPSFILLRLARVISSVISPNQTAFIAGRQILDGCLVANEIIRMAKSEGHKLLLFKVDFEKAFDSVNWSFLQDIIRQMRFGAKWRKWIGACLSSASISVLINGSPSKEFKMEKGLRQGDPLSTLLFLLVGEALQVAILEACNKGLLNASNLIHILKCFEGSSGLKVSISKSRIFGIGVTIAEKSMRSCGGWNGVVDMFNARLSAWNAKNLSKGGRLTLVKSVLDSEWGKCWLKWDRFFLMQLGVLGVGSICDEGGFGSLAYPAGNKGVWYDITKAVSTIEALFPAFKHSFHLKVFNGSNTLFWKDPWGGNWNWRFAPRGRAISDLNTLLSVIGDYGLDGSRDDSWTWTGDVSGLFKVKPLATCVQNSLYSGCELGKHHLWNALVPRKVNICVWRASLNRLPTRLNLSSRGVSLPSHLCTFCETEIEDIGHCLISCPKVVPVWRKIWSWWGLPSPTYFPSFSIKDIALGKIGSYSCAKTCKVLHGVFQCALWSL